MRSGCLRIFLASWSGWSCCPLCEFGFSAIRGILGDWYTLWNSTSFVFMHTAFSIQIEAVCYRERLRLIVFENIAIPLFWASFALHQSTVSLACPNHTNFFHILMVVHRVHCSVKHRLSVPCETSSSWDQSTSDYWMYFTYTSDVIDVLGEVLWQQYIVLQCRINEVTSGMSWIALKYRNCLEELGFKTRLKPFFFGPPQFARKDIQSSIGHGEIPSNFALNSYIISSNRTAPSSSSRGIDLLWRSNLINSFDNAKQPSLNSAGSMRGIDGWCRSNLIISFDNAEQSWQNLSGLVSIHFLSRTRIEMGDRVKTGFGRGFAFATSFSVTLCSTYFQRKWFLTFRLRIC